MKKISAWFVAIVTGVVSLAAMLVCDYLLTLVYYFMEKVPFLTDIIDFAGEILDLGLTALAAAFIATSIWRVGHALIGKIYGEKIAFEKSPVQHVNNSFIFVFLAMVIFVGYQFFTNIGGAVTAYTAGFQGLDKILMFGKAVKDVFLLVRSEHIIFYKIGANSLLLAIISMFVAV